MNGPELRVSIVLPARNAGTTLPACLASIARQTLTGWECIVLDNGSFDGTADVAEAASRRDARIRVVPAPCGSLVATLNHGLRRARAPFIARMDADDLMHPDRLASQVCALERDPGLSAVGCHVRLFPRRGLSPRLREYEGWLNGLGSCEDVARDVFIECPVAHPTLMMRRELATLGYADNGWPEDYDLVLRALGAGLRIGIVRRRLLCWRDSPHRVSRTDPRYSIERFTACKAHYLAAGFLSGGERYILLGVRRHGPGAVAGARHAGETSVADRGGQPGPHRPADPRRARRRAGHAAGAPSRAADRVGRPRGTPCRDSRGALGDGIRRREGLPVRSMISIEAAGGDTYRVTVEEGGSRTVHDVTVAPADAARYAPGVETERLLKASFEFLLEREPKEAILRRFDLPVIERYFPEYPRTIRGRL